MSVEAAAAIDVELAHDAERGATGRGTDLREQADRAWRLCGNDPHRALALARRVHRAAERDDDAVARALALRTEGRALQQVGRVEVAARVLRKAVTACAAAGLLEGQIQALNGMFHVYTQLSDLDAAAEVLEEAARLAADAGDERLLAGARINLSGLRLALGDHEAAAEDARVAARFGRAVGDARMEICGNGNLGRALVLLDDAASGLEAHERALELARQVGDRLLEMCALKYSGEALLALGRPTEAADALTGALELAHAQAAAHDVADTQRSLAVALAAQDRLAEAEQLLVEACAPVGATPSRARAAAYESLSEVRERRGNLAGALAALREAWTALAEAERAESANRAIAAVIRFETVQARAAAERAASDASILAEANAVLELAKAKAERALRIDPLTATTTRRHGMEIVRRALRGGPGGPGSVGMLLIDVDRFKAVNDSLGHAVGDDVLAEVARRIKQSLRLGDITVRWGGEEFLVILPNVDALRVIEIVAERIRERVRSAPVSVTTDVAGVPHVAGIAVTVSIGALYAAPPADARGALAAVDRALYRAKSLGRDRVVGDVLAD